MAGRGRSSTVRIVGGVWRRRRLPVIDVAGCRPTGDRTRETLFNWLRPYLPGARCADLCAGTGVLGFEALSQGADYCVFVDSNAAVVRQLEQTRLALGAERAEIVAADVLAYLAGCGDSFDIVFVDPPFDSALVRPILAALLEHRCLTGPALVYCETARGAPAGEAECWDELKSGHTAQVEFRLLAPRHQ